MKKKCGRLLIIVEIILLLISSYGFLKPKHDYIFQGEELISNGVYLESFLDGLQNGYYVDNSIEHSVVEGLKSTETAELFSIGIPKIDLYAGSYRVCINYKTTANEQTYVVSSDYNEYSITTGRNRVALPPEKNQVEFSVETLRKVKGYQVEAQFCGYDYLFINEIAIEETNALALKVLFINIFVCIVLNILYFRFKRNNYFLNRQELNIIVMLGIAVLIASCGFFDPYMYYGDDLAFHLNRIEGIKDAILAGQLPVRLPYTYLNGYGYPVSIYYCDIFLYIPAFLRMLGFTVQSAYKIYMFLLNVAAAGVSYHVGKRIFKDYKLGIFVSYLYLLMPYRLTNVYLRAAVGEATAICFFPLVVYGLYRIYTEDNTKKENRYNWLPFAIGIIGLIFCHVISTFIAVLLAAIFCMVSFRKTFTKEIIMKLLLSVLFTVLVTAWYIVPFLEFMRLDLAVNNLETYGQVASHGVFLSQILNIFPMGNGGAYTLNGALINDKFERAYSMGAGVLGGLVMAVMAFINIPKTTVEKKRYMAFFGWGMLVLWMATLYFPWDIIEQLGDVFGMAVRSIQFPCRFLNLAGFLFVLVSAAGLKLVQNSQYKSYGTQVGIIIIVLSVLSASYFIADYKKSFQEFRTIDREDVSTKAIGAGEYLIKGTDESIIKETNVIAPENIVVSSKERYKDVLAVKCENLIDMESYIDVPLLYYPHYLAKDMASGEVLNVENGEGNRLRVSIPAGYIGDIHIVFSSPWYWRVCEVISVVTVLGSGIILWKKRIRY